MPSVPTLISGGISLGIIATFISGVYYVIIAGLKWVGKLQASLQVAEEKRADQWSCARCGRNLSRVKTGPSRRVQCARCSSLICRNCCYKTSAASWICSNCRKYRDINLQTGEWFYEQLKKRFYSTVANIPRNANQDGEVRDFMERILEEMVSGELDSVSLRPLSSHPEYVKFCETHHDELALILAKFSLALQMAVSDKILPDSDSPSAIHEELKVLIKKIIKEAMMLPSLKNYSNGSVNKEPLNGEVDELEKKSYEDILATAVINKIVERYQNEIYHYETNNSKSSLKDTNGNVVRRRKLRRQRLTGSVEGANSSDSEGSTVDTDDNYSWSGSTRTDPLSLTIEECIEEVVTKYSTDEDQEEPNSELKHFLSGLKFRRRQRAPFPEFGMDVVDKRHSSSSEEDGNEEGEDGTAIRMGVEVVSPVETWEENWLFQRRRLKTACLSQSMPVPMLVPNPSEDEPRARIGDVDVDETSDLSDCSDSVLEDIIDGSEPDVKRVTKLNLPINQETSSDENSESEEDFFLTNYNRNVIKSMGNLKPKVNGVCNGNIDHGSIINRVNVSIVHNDEDMDTEYSINALDSISHLQTSHPRYNIAEARNNELIIPQVDSGEGSLEMQQDRDYTVEYDAPARVHLNNENHLTGTLIDSPLKMADSFIEKESISITNDNKNELQSKGKPIPKPRSTQNIPQEEESILKSNNINMEEDETDSKENVDVLLMTPPRPGTIAEREHLKWQKAVPLTNNPYSKESIERRQRERLLLSRQSSSDISVEFPELTGANDSSVVHIDCSGRKPDYKQYGRDYYINNDGIKKKYATKESESDRPVPVENEKLSKELNEKCNETLVAKIEEKPQVSVRVEVEVGNWPNSSSPMSNRTTTISSVETRTHITDVKDDKEQHLTTISTSTASADNSNSINDKHHQVTTVSTWNSKSKNNDKNYITLPSVKALAKQFSTSNKDEQVMPMTNTVVQKRLEVQTSPVKQVHSLTARCISKEFREGLRAANQPKPYQVKPIEKIEKNSGNISDDSGTASPTPSGVNPKLYNSIAFWEQMKSGRQ